MKKMLVLLMIGVVCVAIPAFADEVYVDTSNDAYVPDLTGVPDNTGPLGTGDNAADIESEHNDDTAGVQKGQITIHRTDAGFEVFSSLNKVELILADAAGSSVSEGSVGKVTTNGSSLKFEPAGRPELQCPGQEYADWYGPCTLESDE